MKNNSNEELIIELEEAKEHPDSFDILLAEKLCDTYGIPETYAMLNDDQREIVVIGVENERDWYNPVSKNLYLLYEMICSNQSESQSINMEM